MPAVTIYINCFVNSFTFLVIIFFTCIIQAGILDQWHDRLTPKRPDKKDVFLFQQGLSESFVMGARDIRQQALRKNCLADEGQFLEVKYELLRPLVLGLKNGRIDKSHFTQTVQYSSLEQSQPNEVNSIGKIEQSKWGHIASKALTAKRAVRSLQLYLKKFRLIDDIEIIVDLVAAQKKDRKENFELKSFEAIAQLDVRGQKSEKRQHDRLKLSMGFSNHGGAWKISKFQVIAAERITSKQGRFRKISLNSIANKIKSARKSIYQRVPFVVYDVDRDGNTDLLLSDGMRYSYLFTGNGKGGFSLSRKRHLGSVKFFEQGLLSDTNQLLGGIPADNGYSIGTIKSDLSFSPLQNLNISKTYDKRNWLVANFDSDLSDDLLSISSLPRPRAFETKPRALPDLFLRQQKGFRSKENGGNKGSSLAVERSLAMDLNADGQPDLAVLDTNGDAYVYYVSDQKIKKISRLSNNIYGLGVGIDSKIKGSQTYLVFSNISFQHLNRFARSCDQNWEIKDGFVNWSPSVRVMEGNSKGVYKELARLQNPGQGVTDVKLVDYNADGLLDIYVVNGLWSGSRGGIDIADMFYAYANGALPKDLLNNPHSQITQLLKSPDISDLKWGAPKGSQLSLAGFQRNRLFRNLGNGQYVDVAYLEGVDSILDGLEAHFVDINQDKLVDLVLLNNPSVNKLIKNEPLEIFINR